MDDEPWAMQIVLDDDRSERPTHLAACTAVATAVVSVLADPRSAAGGAWEDRVARWQAGPIRKVVRRGRGVRFAAVAGEDGVAAVVAGARVRALVPGPVDAVPPVVSRLQVGGTDLPDRGEPVPLPPGGLLVVTTPEVAMTTGKAAAQAGHAAHLAWWRASSGRRAAWQAAGLPLRVEEADARGWQVARDRAEVSVRDAGYTEIPPGTVTAVAWFTA